MPLLPSRIVFESLSSLYIISVYQCLFIAYHSIFLHLRHIDEGKVSSVVHKLVIFDYIFFYIKHLNRHYNTGVRLPCIILIYQTSFRIPFHGFYPTSHKFFLENCRPSLLTTSFPKQRPLQRIHVLKM